MKWLPVIPLTCTLMLFGCEVPELDSPQPTLSETEAVASDRSSPSSEGKSASITPTEQPPGEIVGIPIYVTPFYNYEGLQINVGTFSEELASATMDSIAELTEMMQSEWATLPIVTMYVTSIRLYDLGLKDEAVRWFYSAQYRARLFQSILPEESLGGIGSEGFELIHAHQAFQQLAGEYINGYAFGELGKLQDTIRLVKSENQQISHFSAIYPRLDFIESNSWPEKNKIISDGLDKLLDYTTNNAEEIKSLRKQNGIEGKY